MKSFKVRKLTTALIVSGLLSMSSHAIASAFQLWEQDTTSVANFHAGYAASAYNASTAFYNPAGLSRFKEQQFVLSGSNVTTDIKYRGTVSVNTLNDNDPQPVTAQGGNYAFVPAMYYVAPLSDVVAFGLSVNIPFGLKTNYGKQTLLRYVSTVTSVQVIDISPVLSFKLNDQWSIGFGPDIQMMKGEFNQVGGANGTTEFDSDGLNTANDTGYGMHAGVMYEYNENTRAGLSYHSQAVHHLTGNSSFNGPLAVFLGTTIQSTRAKLDLTLPPYTALSAYHKLNQKVALMGSVIYTQWNTIQYLVLHNVAGISNTVASTDIIVTIPQHFRNTYNISLGADYSATDTITLRAGIGYDQTPVKNAYRNVQLPDNNHYAFAIGGHIQSTPTLGFDLGWSHIMINKAHISPPTQVTGDETTNTNGSVTGGADVLSMQLVWDMV